MPNTPPKRPTRTELIYALPDIALTEFAKENTTAYRVFAAMLKVCDNWGTVYKSAADLGRDFNLHRANVGTAIRALIEAGWVTVKDGGAGRAQTLILQLPPSAYRLCKTHSATNPIR